MEIAMPQAKTLKDSELKTVLAVITQTNHPERNRAMFLLSYWAGMRVGEIAALKICDVIGENGKIKEQIYLHATQTKGNKGRTVTLSDKLRKELANYASTIKSPGADWAFIPSQRDRKNGFTSNSLGQEFISIYKRAGIDAATSHSGRRTFITNLANKGVSARVLMALAGHRNLSTTQRYIDVNDDLKRVAVNLL